MYEGKRVVLVTPAGRKRYLELLIPQVLAWREVVDEYRLWVNTVNQDDISYMKSIHAQYPEFIKLEYLPTNVQYMENYSIHVFFRNCVDTNTIYVRLDDDVVLLDTLDAFKGFLDFRMRHPEYLLVFGNILNNAVITHIHQRLGTLPRHFGVVGYNSMDELGWKSGPFAERLHGEVLSKPTLCEYRLPIQWQFFDSPRVSVNFISWLGETFAQFGGQVHPEEEAWLTTYQPMVMNMCNVMYGGFVCVHYAFGEQRPHIEKTNILTMYKERVHEMMRHQKEEPQTGGFEPPRA